MFRRARFGELSLSQAHDLSSRSIPCSPGWLSQGNRYTPTRTTIEVDVSSPMHHITSRRMNMRRARSSSSRSTANKSVLQDSDISCPQASLAMRLPDGCLDSSADGQHAEGDSTGCVYESRHAASVRKALRASQGQVYAWHCVVRHRHKPLRTFSLLACQKDICARLVAGPDMKVAQSLLHAREGSPPERGQPPR